MARLQYNGPDTDVLKNGGVYERDEHPDVDDELWSAPADLESEPETESEPEPESETVPDTGE